jgi:hypothetical protein
VSSEEAMEEILVMEIKVHYWVLVLEFLQRFRLSIRVSGWKRQTFLPFEGVLKGGYGVISLEK